MFRLRKWYLDCVGPAGDGVIGYSARLHWRALRVGYASTLAWGTEGEPREVHSFRAGRAPLVDGDVRWRCPSVGAAGIWRPSAPPLSRTLLQLDHAAIRWECVAPRARARVRLPGGTVSGLGYAERLELTLEPWRLPFHTLHWGRFLAGEAVLVWIVWEGEHSAATVFLNGDEVVPASFSATGIGFHDGSNLDLRRARVLRDAAIVSPVLRRVPGLARRVPPGFLSAREEKWLSRGSYSMPGAPPVSGWAIHELVRFR